MIQLQFLNAVLDRRDTSLITLNNLDESFFSDYKEEFRFIKNHIDAYGNAPDKTTFLASFPNFDIISVNESDRYLIQELYRDKSKGLLAKTFNNVKKLVQDGNVEDATQLLISASQSISSAKHLETVDILNNSSRYGAYVDRLNDYSKYYVKTGFAELDKIIGGWDRQEELATIVARSNVGKSWMLIKCALAAVEQGLTVGIYSGEMSENKVGYRFDTLASHISNSGMTKGRSDIQNDYKRYIEGLPNRFKGKLKVLTPNMINGTAGVNALRTFIEKDNLDMLCIDQHSLLEDDRGAKDPTAKASNISRDIKNLQVMKKIPIIAVSQQNRSSTENGVGMEHIAQSDRIGQDSTIVLFFEQKDGILTLKLLKSRDSENKKDLHYAVDFDKGVFSYIPEEDNALDGDGIDELQTEFEEETF